MLIILTLVGNVEKIHERKKKNINNQIKKSNLQKRLYASHYTVYISDIALNTPHNSHTHTNVHTE